MNHLLAMKFSDFLAEGLDKITKIKICYLFESIIGEVEKIVIIFIIFSIIDKRKEVLIVIAVLISLRPYVGGFHCKNYFTCLFYSILMCAVSIFLGRFMSIYKYTNIIVVLGFGTFIVAKIPIKSKDRKMYTEKMRLVIKIKALLILICISITSNILKIYKCEIMTMVILILMNALLEQLRAFISNYKERIYEKFNSKPIG